MSKTKYTNAQLSELRDALAKHGVALPENIQIIDSGFFGTCFVGDTVLKLFSVFRSGVLQSPQDAEFERKHFDTAIQACAYITDAAHAITRRGVEVPRLIDSGRFLVEGVATPLQLGNGERFHAWQMMTRVDGRPLGKTPRFEKPPQSPLADRKIARALAQIAAKIHVRVDAADKKIEDGPKLIVSRPLGLDQRTFALLAALEKDIKKLTPPGQTTTLLHGDLFPQNVLKSAAGKYGVIDWDHQKFGRPERDIWGAFHMQPQRIREYCNLYNATAKHPIDERLVVAHALTSCAHAYTGALARNNEQPDTGKPARNKTTRYSKFKRSQTLATLETRIVDLAKIMHQLTGKKAYAEAAKDFSGSQNPLGRPIAARIKPNLPTAKS
ncbi:MAG: aminoglycoside phosphotransferase family protein [Alphaproteobacteria bacterium]